MKIINKTLIFLFVALFSRSIDIDIKSPQCAIGSIEAEHFAKANHKIPLISYSDFSNHIENLVRYDQRFTNTSFINTQLINIAPDTLVLKNGSCIKINSNHNQIESIIFISNNYRMEWDDIEVFMRVLKPFNSKEHWYSSDLYKLAINFDHSDLKTSKDYNGIQMKQHNIQGSNTLTLYNENTKKMFIFLYKTPYSAL